MQKQGIAEQVCRSRALMDMCAEAGYCWESGQILDIAGQVCRSKAILGNSEETV